MGFRMFSSTYQLSISAWTDTYAQHKFNLIIILRISLHGTPQFNYLLSQLILIRSTDAIQNTIIK